LELADGDGESRRVGDAGREIRLKRGRDENNVVVVVAFMAGVEVWISSLPAWKQIQLFTGLEPYFVSFTFMQNPKKLQSIMTMLQNFKIPKKGLKGFLCVKSTAFQQLFNFFFILRLTGN